MTNFHAFHSTLIKQTKEKRFTFHIVYMNLSLSLSLYIYIYILISRHIVLHVANHLMFVRVAMQKKLLSSFHIVSEIVYNCKQ